jgi:hypothetical protein
VLLPEPAVLLPLPELLLPLPAEDELPAVELPAVLLPLPAPLLPLPAPPLLLSSELPPQETMTALVIANRPRAQSPVFIFMMHHPS